MKEEGRIIIDIGPDFARRRRYLIEGKSPYSEVYEMERMELKGYEGYHKAFIRRGKWWGGVPGLDPD